MRRGQPRWPSVVRDHAVVKAVVMGRLSGPRSGAVVEAGRRGCAIQRWDWYPIMHSSLGDSAWSPRAGITLRLATMPLARRPALRCRRPAVAFWYARFEYADNQDGELTNSDVVRVGLVGCGKISEAYLTAGYPNVTYVACADIDEDRARVTAEAFGLQPLPVSALLSNGEIEVVCNLTVPRPMPRSARPHSGTASTSTSRSLSVCTGKRAPTCCTWPTMAA